MNDTHANATVTFTTTKEAALVAAWSHYLDAPTDSPVAVAGRRMLLGLVQEQVGYNGVGSIPHRERGQKIRMTLTPAEARALNLI